MPRVPTFGSEAPVCPMCDGPCTHDFERSPYVFPDQLRHTDTEGNRTDPADPPKKPKPTTKRGRRMRRPTEDRMHRPSEDRSA